jgi:hypothetical protein
MACEALGRQAVLIELDPAYCDVIVTRWQEATGKVATRASDGMGFVATQAATGGATASFDDEQAHPPSAGAGAAT